MKCWMFFYFIPRSLAGTCSSMSIEESFFRHCSKICYKNNASSSLPSLYVNRLYVFSYRKLFCAGSCSDDLLLPLTEQWNTTWLEFLIYLSWLWCTKVCLCVIYRKTRDWLDIAVWLAKPLSLPSPLTANKKVRHPRILDISTYEADENCQDCVGEGKREVNK